MVLVPLPDHSPPKRLRVRLPNSEQMPLSRQDLPLLATKIRRSG